MAAPKVSVLFPVYNTKESYLREAIESLLNQTMTDFELLIYNDGSTDPNVERVVLSYVDKRIRYIRGEKNLGITPARNRLIEEAAGEYLAIADHDDISRPERFARETALLDACPEVGVVGTWAKIFPRKRKKIWQVPVDHDEIEVVMMYKSSIIHTSAMIRKSLLFESGVRYEERYTPAEDYALFARLVGKTKFANIPEILVDYRQHGNNTSLLKKEAMKIATFRIHAFVQNAHPERLKEFAASHQFKTNVFLFGWIPILVIHKKRDQVRWLLFGVIPLLKFRYYTK